MLISLQSVHNEIDRPCVYTHRAEIHSISFAEGVGRRHDCRCLDITSGEYGFSHVCPPRPWGPLRLRSGAGDGARGIVRVIAADAVLGDLAEEAEVVPLPRQIVLADAMETAVKNAVAILLLAPALGRSRLLVEAVVDAAIAVLVHAVAGFGCRLIGLAFENTVLAGLVTLATGAHASTDHIAVGTTFGVALVDAAVAVVVDVVAELRGGIPRHRVTHRRLVVRGADHVATPVAGTNTVVAGRAEAEALVGRAVAVVVLRVARLGGRELLPQAHTEVATDAGLLTAVADAHTLSTGRASVAAPRERAAILVFVGRAVAVIVHVVADFSTGQTGCGRALQ